MANREAELQTLLDTVQALSNIGIWEWTVATGEVKWSDELYRIYGLEPQSVPITLESFLSFILASERARVEREIQSALANPSRFTYREVIVRPDGSHRTLDTTGDAITDAQGVVIKLVGTCRDVTEVVLRDERLRFYGDVFELAQVGLSGWQLDHSNGPPRLRLVAFNRKTEELVGAPLGPKLGRTLVEVVPVLDETALLDEARALTETSPIRRFVPFRRSDERTAPWLVATVFPLPGRHVGLALEDVTSQVRTQLLQAGERRALEMLAAGAPQVDILTVIVRAIEEACPQTIGSVLLLGDDGNMHNGAAPGLPDAYNREIEGHPIGEAVGSCGSAMFRRARVVVTDIQTDPLWADYRELANEHGLRACWSQPIFGDHANVLGAFALYHREPTTPDEPTFALLDRAAHVTGIVIERRALDDQLRELTGRIEAAREDERTMIARDIHDQLGQTLTALKLDIGWLRRRIEAAALVDKLDEMARSADEVLRSVRRISSDLRPGILDDLGLRAAIEWLAEDFEHRSGTHVEVTGAMTELRLDRSLATNVFRIVQEALTNIARHANAKHVGITIGLQHGQLHVEVVDDGVGLPEIGPRGTTLGILGMRERARRMGGECSVKRRDPSGTVVHVVVPLRFPEERASS